MGKTEEKYKKKKKKENLQKIILGTIKIAGFVSVGFLAPNVLVALDKLGFLPKERQGEYISSSASKLVKRGLLKFVDNHYELTFSGQKLLNHWELLDYKVKKPKKWDKKWRIIIFDIPEKKKKVRNRITGLLRRAGFVRLQDSVWVYPYDCEDLIGLLKTDFGVGKYLLYVIADEIENDRHLRQDFSLT
mgnify:CR=1 FL=1